MNTTKKSDYFPNTAKTCRHFALLGLVALTVSSSAQETVFGSDNEGYGGFASGASASSPATTPAPAWVITSTGAQFTNAPTEPIIAPATTPDSGQVNSSLLKEFILDRSDGKSYAITGVIDLVSAVAADNNRFGISIFANPGDLAGIDTGLSLQLNIGTTNSQSIRLGINSTVNSPTPPISPITNANFVGKTLTFEGLITFIGSDVKVDFTVRASGLFTGPENDIPYAQTITHTVTAASVPGNFFGFGSRGRVRNGNLAHIYEAKSFSIVDTSPPPAGPPVLVITPNTVTLGNYDFSWASQAGKEYDLVSSTDLSTAIGTWPVWEGLSGLSATPPDNVLANVPGGGDVRRFFALAVRDAPTLFAEDFDAAAALPAGWTSNGPVNGTDWQVGVPSGVMSGPVTAFTEPNCAGTNIAGYYTENTDVSLVSPVISIPAASGATLSFRQLIDTDDFDAGSVRVLDADDADAPIIGLALNNLRGTGSDGDGWTENTLALPAVNVGGKNIKIEFRFVSNAGSSQDIDIFSGFYVDDVSVALD